MRTRLLLLSLLIASVCAAQDKSSDKYNTVRYYPYFDYKCNDTVKKHYVTGIGNMKDSVKTGLWTYYLPDGRILAQGKYRNGLKRGRWEYHNGTVLIWERSAMAKDHISYDYRNGMAQIVDVVNTRFTYYKVVNGITQIPPHVYFRFL
jgi:hypothetical protein